VDLIRSLEATVAAQHDQLNSLRIIVSDLYSRLPQQTSDPTQRSDAPLQSPQEVTQLMPTFPTTMALPPTSPSARLPTSTSQVLSSAIRVTSPRPTNSALRQPPTSRATPPLVS
jgi:hypothetical protein